MCLLMTLHLQSSSTKWQIQQKVTNLSSNSKSTGLKINSEKSKFLRLNTTSNENVQVDEQDIEDVEMLCVLGCIHLQVRWHWRRHQRKVRESKGLHISSWMRSGRTVNLLATGLRSKFSNLMSSRCCCMVVNAGEWPKQTRKNWMRSYIRAFVGCLRSTGQCR